MDSDGVYLTLEWCEGTKNVLPNFIFCVFLHKSKAQNTGAIRDIQDANLQCNQLMLQSFTKTPN